MSIVHRWGSGDETIGGFWDIPRYGFIPLGLVKLLGLGLLGLVISELSNLQKGISFISQGF